jgi:hypothetical protein
MPRRFDSESLITVEELTKWLHERAQREECSICLTWSAARKLAEKMLNVVADM